MELMSSPLRSPLPDAPSNAVHIPPPPQNTPDKSAPPLPPIPSLPPTSPEAHANRSHTPPPADGGRWFSWSGGGGGGHPPPQSPAVNGIVRRRHRDAAARNAAVAARMAAAVLCLVAFSVLAADKRKGWALDSYDKYSQFRYSMAVNVIGFIYSLFQLYAQVHHIRKGKHIISRPMGDYFDFTMDQAFAYLMISASSSATARTSDWITNWGNDPFPRMANGSIAMSFLAFLAFALSSLISAYNLFSPNLSL
ncbi:CASP-like protein 4A2 [Typha angustifolia]|uniref:CASP-like protein 4A2 n=1 Tax=Typha angustifolia TaxID=59011 RepID=UPI003C2E8718